MVNKEYPGSPVGYIKDLKYNKEPNYLSICVLSFPIIRRSNITYVQRDLLWGDIPIFFLLLILLDIRLIFHEIWDFLNN